MATTKDDDGPVYGLADRILQGSVPVPDQFGVHPYVEEAPKATKPAESANKKAS